MPADSGLQPEQTAGLDPGPYVAAQIVVLALDRFCARFGH